MTPDTETVNLHVRRARQSKIVPPKTTEEKKEQDQKQREAAQQVIDLQKKKDAEDRATLQAQRQANRGMIDDPEAFGALSGRASEIPILRRTKRGRVRKGKEHGIEGRNGRPVAKKAKGSRRTTGKKFDIDKA